MQLEDAQADFIIIRNILNKSPIYISLDSIKNYYHFNRDNEEYIDAEVFNPALDEYNIERGTSVKDIISLMINNWEYYNPDMRKDLVCKFSHAVTTDVLIDLITAYAESKKHNAELSEKYLKVPAPNRHGQHPKGVLKRHEYATELEVGAGLGLANYRLGHAYYDVVPMGGEHLMVNAERKFALNAEYYDYAVKPYVLGSFHRI